MAHIHRLGAVIKSFLCAYFYCWFVCIPAEYSWDRKGVRVFPPSFKDAKSRWGVMILMNSSTCQFENVHGKQMKGRIAIFICYYSMTWRCRRFLLHLWRQRLELNNRQPFNIKHYQAWGNFIVWVFNTYFIVFFVCLCLWSLIPLTKNWAYYCFPLSPKLIL